MTCFEDLVAYFERAFVGAAREWVVDDMAPPDVVAQERRELEARIQRQIDRSVKEANEPLRETILSPDEKEILRARREVASVLVLAFLQTQEKPVTVKEIREGTQQVALSLFGRDGILQGTLNGALRQLEDKGILLSHRAEQKGGRATMALTDAGRSVSPWKVVEPSIS